MAKFLRRGKTKVFYIPTIASQTAPTQAELTAGTELTNLIGSMSGFNFKSTTIDIPNFGSRQTPKIPGENTSDDSSMNFYEDDTSNPIRTTLAKDVTGYILIAPAGLTAAGSKVDVFPIQVSANTRQYTTANEAAQFVVDYAITAAVSQDATMAA